MRSLFRLRTLQCYQKTFTPLEGERVLYDLIKRFGGLRSSFEPKGDGIETALHMAKLEGSREVIAYIADQLSYDAQKLDQIVKQESEHEAGNERTGFDGW